MKTRKDSVDEKIRSISFVKLFKFFRKRTRTSSI